MAIYVDFNQLKNWWQQEREFHILLGTVVISTSLSRCLKIVKSSIIEGFIAASVSSTYVLFLHNIAFVTN